jgi:hypothetical protein
MKIFQTVILVILVLMSLSAGAVKLLQMPQEVKFFEDAGLGVALLMALGAVQILGGVLAAVPKFKLPGASIIAAGFFTSTIVIFMTGQIAFGAFSLLPVIFAGLLIAGARKQNAPGER